MYQGAAGGAHEEANMRLFLCLVLDLHSTLLAQGAGSGWKWERTPHVVKREASVLMTFALAQSAVLKRVV